MILGAVRLGAQTGSGLIADQGIPGAIGTARSEFRLNWERVCWLPVAAYFRRTNNTKAP